MAIGNLVANLSVNSAPFKKGLGQAKGKMKSFASGMKSIMKAGVVGGLGLATVAVAGMTKQLGELDKVAKLSSRTGFSAKTIAGMGFAAEQTGSDVGSMNKAFDKFNRSMGEAAGGSGAAHDALNDLGLSIDDLQAMSSDDRLLAVSDAIAGLKDPSLQAAAAADIFGRSGVELVNVLGMGSEGIKQFQAEADKLGLGFDAKELARVEQANDAMNRIKRSIGGAFGAMAVEFAPMITNMSEGLLTVVSNIKAVMGPIKTFVVGTWHTVQDAIADVGIVIGVITADWSQMWEGLFKDIPKFAGAAFAWVEENAQTMIDNMIAMISNIPAELGNMLSGMSKEMQIGMAVAFPTAKALLDVAEGAGVEGGAEIKKLTEFKMPEFSKETEGVVNDLTEALAIAKKEREAARSGAGKGLELSLPKLDQFDPTESTDSTDDTKEELKKTEQGFAGVAAQGSSEAFALLAKSSQQMPQVKEQKETNKILRGMAKVFDRQAKRDAKLEEVGIA